MITRFLLSLHHLLALKHYFSPHQTASRTLRWGRINFFWASFLHKTDKIDIVNYQCVKTSSCTPVVTCIFLLFILSYFFMKTKTFLYFFCCCMLHVKWGHVFRDVTNWEKCVGVLVRHPSKYFTPLLIPIRENCFCNFKGTNLELLLLLFFNYYSLRFILYLQFSLKIICHYSALIL